MNPIFRINISGYEFVFFEDAYQLINRHLSKFETDHRHDDRISAVVKAEETRIALLLKHFIADKNITVDLLMAQAAIDNETNTNFHKQKEQIRPPQSNNSNRDFKYQQQISSNIEKPKKQHSVIARLFGVLIILSGLFVITLIVGIAIVATGIIGYMPGFEERFFVNYVFSESLIITVAISAFLLLTIPVIIYIYAGIALLFDNVSNKHSFILTAVGAWIIAGIVAIGSTVGAIDNFRVNAEIISETPIEVTQKEIVIKTNNKISADFIDYLFEINNYRLVKNDEKEYIIARPNLTISPSKNEEFMLEIEKLARGNTLRSAKRNAENIIFSSVLSGDTLIIDPYYVIKAGEKWRSQKTKVTLYMPVGASIYLDENTIPVLNRLKNISNVWVNDMPGLWWTMTSEGLEIIKQQ